MATYEQLRLFPLVTEKDQEIAEEQILQQQKIVDYDIHEYPVEVLVQKYLDGLENETNELFVPKYQRYFVWTIPQQSKFIESIMLGLPIPYMFAADSKENEGRLEIVDGSQRIRTLEAFLSDKFTLTKLKKLNKLNGFKFSDLPISRQRRFRRQTLRLIALTDKATREVRKELFDRINTSSTLLTDMESRKGIYEGDFYYFLEQCANNSLFKKLCPIPESRTERAEGEEMILRFFAYSERYQDFVHIVKDFLDDYMKDMQSDFTEEHATKLRNKFEQMLSFVNKYFPYGFTKSLNANSTPRVRFEAISVGVQLALEINSNLTPKNVSSWIESEEFKYHTRTDAANDKKKVLERIEYVKNKLLEK
mgnify:CR=1 FL=1